MCKLLIAVNAKNEPNEKFENAVKLQFPIMRKEEDGCGAVVINRAGELKVFRSISDYGEVFGNVLRELPEAKVVAIHTRTKTSGDVNLENVHFFQIGNRLFAHNGFVPTFHKTGTYGFEFGLGYRPTYKEDTDEYTETKLEEILASCEGCQTATKGYCKRHKKETERLEFLRDSFCMDEGVEGAVETAQAIIVKGSGKKNSGKIEYSDSYEFLKTLPKKETEKSIFDHIVDTRFSGMGVLLNKDTGKIFLIIRKECFSLSDMESYGVFYSFNPILTHKEQIHKDYFGIPFNIGNKETKIAEKPEKMFEGVFELKTTLE